jgi:hypothetical protein
MSQLRATIATLGVIVLVGFTPASAAADPPQPTNYRSTIVEITPDLPAGVTARIIGGDSLVELAMDRGHTALVSDYPRASDAKPVPYLRFDADGTVHRNVRSVAATANEARYGTTDQVPDPEGAPRWEHVASDGRYAWHDHRIHWMSPTPPRLVDDDGRVDLGGANGTWSIPLIVDGTPTAITGTLVLEPAPAPIPWLALTAVLLALTLGATLRFGLRAGCAIAIVTSLAMTWVNVAAMDDIPKDVGGSPVPMLLGTVTLISASWGLARSARIRLIATAGTAACMLGWVLTRWTVLTRSVLPTTLHPNADRGVTAAALGVGLALAIALVWKPPAGKAGQEPGREAEASPGPTTTPLRATRSA